MFSDLEALAALEAYRPAYTIPTVTVDEAESEAEARYAACPYGDYECAQAVTVGEWFRCTECQVDQAYEERENRLSDTIGGEWI